MKTITVDPADEEESDPPGFSSSSEEDESFLDLRELSLDRTSPEVERDPLPEEAPLPAEGSSKIGRPKRPSFREMFRLPRKKRSSSKSKPTGCAGWLDKKRKKTQSESSFDEIPTSDQDRSISCSRCGENSSTPLKGVTYSKNASGIFNMDGDWLCPQCSSRGSSLESDQSIHHVPRLSYLVMDVVKLHPQMFTLTNLNSVRKREDLGADGVADMITISDLNEASLLWNLKTRYDHQNIYTFIGNILVSVNPYQMFDVYGLDMVKRYENEILGTLPPHLFAIGSAAYDRLVSRDQPAGGESQVVIISGESGAGKTEATKLIMQYLAAVNKKDGASLVTEQILEASPLLESFGNATTVRNDNSSRFGKYTQIFFQNGVITGAKITEYLLEKSRIVTQAADERNYHVFYELLKGLRTEEKERYGLTAAENYFYLNQGGHCESSTKHDGQDFKALMSAMQILDFSSEEQDTIFRILASVLHLGNVFFHRKALKHGQEGVEMGSDAEVRWVSHLLQLRTDGIVSALTTKTTEARNERLHTPLNIDQALDARDAIAKALYSSLFGWLVNRVNSIVNKGERSTAINILDIFGFEDFPENSFEQLCINYANENLQFHFNKHIFKLEQQEYAKERIEWQTISFTDNQPVISLIAKKPIGVLHLLDDESNFPKATDASFLEKCHYNHALNELYFRPRMSSMEFGIKHYAGQVWYNADGFLDKNRDTLRPDVVELLISSRIQMISRMFQDMKRSQDSNKTINKGDGRFITMKPRTATVAARFHDSLQALLDSMSKCNPWFVRCLKPNRDKAPMTFDLPVVLEQLRYTGMLETIRIRKLGFPIRMRFDQFLERYGCLLTRRERRSLTRQTPSPDICRLLLDRNSSDGQDFQLGTSKVFMRELLEQQLERKRQDQLKEAAIKIQRSVRTHLDRRDFLIKRQSAILIQAWVRRYQAQKRYKTIRKGVVLAQAHFRATRQRRLYKELREELLRRQTDQVKPAVRKQQEAAAATFSVNHKEARGMAGINQLEIPAELAFIYSKLEDWKPIHTERNVVKVVGAVPAAEMDRQLPNDLDHHAFTKFTNIYFKSHLWGAKKEPIQTPLLPKNSEADVTESLAIFKLILRFTSGPRSSDPATQTKREMALGNYIVHKGIVNEQLRDEIYCQLCNQTWKNEDPQAVGRCWILMANCLSAFPPSPALYKYLLKYVSDHAYDGYRATCQQKLMQAYELDPPISRAYPPTVMEWKANRKCVNMALEARYPDDESRHAGVDSWSTAESVASLLMRSRGMEAGEAEGWTLSLGQENDWYDLNGHDFVLDVVSELETPPAFPIHKEGHFLNSSQSSPPTRNTRRSGNARLPPRPPGAGNESGRRSAAVIGNKRYMKSEQHQGGPRSPGKFSRSLDNLLNTEPTSKVMEVEPNQMGLSRSRLNDRYRSMDKLKTSNSSLGMIQRSESQRHSGVVHPRPATAGGEAEWGKLGLSSSALNSRYFSQQNLKGGPRQTTDSDSSEPAEKPRRKKSSASKSNGQNLPKRREPSGRGGDSSGDNLSDMDYRHPGASSGAGHSGGASRNNNKEEYLNGRNGRFIKAPLPGNANKKTKGAVLSSRAYIETRHSEPREHLGSKSSGLSDTSETVSLSSHVRRVRVPSQSSDVDQYLDDLFMPVLDGNMDEYSDARSLAASIKGGHRNNDNLDDFLNDIVDTIRPDSSLLELEGASLPELIQGGAKGHSKEPKSGGFHQGQAVSGRDSSASFQPIGINIAAPPTPLGMVPTPSLLMPGYYGAYGHPFAMPGGPIPADPSGGFNKYPGEYPPHLFGPASPLPFPYTTSSPLPFFHLPQGYASMGAPTNAASGPSSATDLNRAFLQSAVVQNMQIQQQLMAQNQALQQLLQAQVAPTILVPPTSSHSLITPISPTPTAVHAPNSVQQQEDPVDYDDTDSSSCSIGEGAGVDVNNDDASLWRIEAPPPSSLLSRTGSRGIGDQAPPPPVLPKVRRDSGLPVLESRPSFSHRVQSDGTSEHALSRKRDSIGTEPTVFKGAPPPPPPPLPPEPIFGDPSAATHNLMDPYGRAKTVRIGKWRWPPARSDDDPAPPLTTGSFLEFKMQKNLNKKNNKAQESPQSYEGVEWDSFEIDEDSKGEEENDPPQDRKSSSSSRERSISPVRGPPREVPSKPAGSIGKLKISSEMRAKLELVTVAHGESSNRPAGQQQQIEPERNAGVVRKLEENRRLMLQQQLAGRKWDSVEEVERITRRAQSEDRSDFNHQNASRPSVSELAERARRNSETAIRRSSSPPTPFFSKHENGHDMRKLSIDDDLAVKALEGIHTKLYGPLNAPFFTYNMVPWTLHVRKELFSPSENSLVHPLALHLIFCQVVQDTYNDACLRIGHEDRIRMQNMLENYGITPINASGGHHKVTLKRNVVETAKQWPLYFARLYPVSGGKQLADVQYLAVSHSGIRLVKRESGHQQDTLHVLQSFGFSDISNVSSSPRSSALQIHLRSPAAANSPLHFFTQRAGLIRDLIHRFANEAEKEPEEYVRAVADYVTRESSLLSFRKGDVIRVIRDEQYVDKGWMFGKLDGRVGIFPADYVEPMSRNKSRQPRNGAPPVDNLPDKEEEILLPTVKRIFAPPKAAVPVEIRRQRRLLVSPPTAPPPPPPPPPPPAPFREYQSLPIQQPKRSHGVKQEDCGLFRQIFSDDEAAMIVYNFPGINRKPEELVYAEPSMECTSSSTDPMFSSSSSSDYADPFEQRKRSGSLPDHHYVELDDVMDRHLSLGHRRAVFLCDTPTRFDSISDDMYLEGPTAPVPVGLTRSRTVHFESMAQEPNNNLLMQAVGPQLALYSLTSLPPAHLMDDGKESCCQSSMMSADNDEFFMEFSIQRIPVPSEEEETAVTSSSSTSSSISPSSLSISSSESSSSSSIQSVVEMPKKPRKVSFLEPAETVKLDRTLSRKRKMNKNEERRAGKLDFIRLLRHTLSAIGRCGLSSAQSVLSSHLSSSEDVDSLFSTDDLLSQSDLDMFCKESKDRCTEDSGTDEMATTPEPQKPSSVYGGTLTDIENTLNILEHKARGSLTDSSTSSSEEDDRSSSGSSGCSCESSSCSYWSEDDWIFDDNEDGPVSPHDTSLDLGSSDTSRMEDPGSPTQPNDGKHSLLQFALYHFRQSPENKFEMLRSDDGPNSLSPSTNGKSDKKSKSKSKKSGAKDQGRSSDGVTAGSDWTWKEQVDLVKFTKSPIQASLLQLDSNDLNKLALECFLSIMRYMGDYPMAKGQSEVDNVYTILMNCHKHESLRDETYCQIMKQTTNNKSSRPDSCQRGWRLFSITAAYFSCSEVLKPYLFKYLETAAYDKRRAYHGTAMVCLQNLRKTLRYGGRKNVPSIEEITAITAGRNSKRQMYRLPGGTERVINTKSTSVVQDIIEEICSVINVRSEQEMEEYSLYCIVEGDTFTMPLAREEYILDVTTELQKNQQVYYLIFCRSVWHYPMRLDNSLYIEIVFNQIAPDYLEGLLLVMPGEQISQDCVYDIAKVAALLHRAADLDHMPTMKETKYLLPKPALSVRDIKPPQWVNLVQSSWREVEHLKPSQAKAQVLEILEKWPLFGSSFFAVRRDSDPAERSEHILALNRNGVHFLDVITHETLMHYPYSEVISTRKVKSDDGILFLDMKCGNLMQQRVTRIQTDQAHEISRLIRQYITIQQRVQQKDAESNLASR